ncbi:MAG: tetratricopeptide repeat protein [Spirochaetales bacterium]|nr:tetratricopeptide repeat protein [Spirochaetales bacterium]
MSKEYDEFKKLISYKKFRQAALFAEEQYFIDKSTFWITQQAHAYIRAGSYEKALERAREALAREPDNSYALMSGADALFGLHRFNEALEYYKETINHVKLQKRAVQGICECLIQLKQWQQLIDDYVTFPGPEDDYILYKIKALSALEKTDEAITLCKATLTRIPDNPPILWELTELEIKRDGIDYVIEQMGRLTKISSLPPVYKEIYASLCRRAGKNNLALKTYEKIGTGIQDLRIQKKKAFTLAKTGCEEEAIPLIEELLKIDPKDIYLHSSYGAACSRIGAVQKGIDFYYSLLALFPGEKRIYGYISRLKKKLGPQ